MTGFGSARRRWSSPDGPLSVHVELRSVNARFLELKLRHPFGAALDHELRTRLGGRVGRGRVELAVVLRRVTDDAAGLARLGVDPAALSEVLAAVADLQRTASNQLELSPPTALEILRFLQVSGRAHTAGSEAPETPPPFLHEVVDEALEQMCTFRDREGAALAQVLGDLVDALAQQMLALRRDLGPQEAALTERFTARLSELADRVAGAGVDPDRVAQEVAVLLARGDVAEELARVDSHLAQAREVLAQDAAPGQGKTIEFLAQELFREITTIGSKIGSHAGSRIVIEAKGTIERIREQVQNVE
jgi:uncharacterized protein (TIGR00255 family)